MYSPFGKDISDVLSSDLNQLIRVAEGWYVEYKSELSNGRDIAKSISAFANTYGGWIFYGVKEKGKSDPVAGSFPGISSEDACNVEQKIRQAVAEHMNPDAYFNVHIIQGDGDILVKGRAVVCVHVPESMNAPHVHASGRIYRRVADSSEPKPENDRFLLEALFNKSNNLRDSYKEWIKRDLELSEEESKTPYVRLMITLDPWRNENRYLSSGLAEIRDIFSNTVGKLGTMPLDTVYTSSTGYTARQAKGNDPHIAGIIWRLYNHLESDIYIPINRINTYNYSEISKFLEGYLYKDRLIELLEYNKYEYPNIIDMNHLFLIIISIVEINQKILEHLRWSKTYHIKTRVINTWRTLPFLDIEDVVDSYRKYGLPICLDSIVMSPHGYDPESFIAIPDEYITEDSTNNPFGSVMPQSIIIFEQIARSFGLPSLLEGGFNTKLIGQLYEVGERAREVSKNRGRV